MLDDNLMSGYVFILFNKNRDKMKLLDWETDGYLISHNQLEKGSFEIIRGHEGKPKQSIRFDHLVIPLSSNLVRDVVQQNDSMC